VKTKWLKARKSTKKIMGCGESKIKSISLAQDNSGNNEDHIEMTKKQSLQILKGENYDFQNSNGIENSKKNITDEALPNRLLSAIPISDLGESLDSRHLSESFNGNNKFGKGLGGTSADSVDSNDSGYDEYEEEYSHIITENSSVELIKKVEQDFRVVDLPELLVITGRACTRILSGYQKTKADETRILESLRDEGLLAKPKGKTAGGVSFEVVDASIVSKTEEGLEDSQKDAFVSADFIPAKTLRRLNSRRGTIKRPKVELEVKLAEAEVRRKELEEEKVNNVMERSGLERHGRMRSASAYKREQQYSATVAKRQQQLQEMRDRLKEKHKKNDMVKLKKQLQFGGDFGASFDSGFKMKGVAVTGAASSDFFDD